MNKKQFLNTYKTIDSLSQDQTSNSEPSIYRSKQDERLIKDFHYARFQKNFDNIQNNDAFRDLLEKENWDTKDIQTLLESLG